MLDISLAITCSLFTSPPHYPSRHRNWQTQAPSNTSHRTQLTLSAHILYLSHISAMNKASLLLEFFQGIRMKVSADEKHVQFTQTDTPEQVYTHFIALCIV